MIPEVKYKIKRAFLIVPVLALGLSAPVVQADIFLKPHGDKSEQAEKKSAPKPLFYVPYQQKKSTKTAKKSSKNSPYYKKKSTKLIHLAKAPAAGYVDPIMLTMAGEPTSVAELRAASEALKSLKLQAMVELQNDSAFAVARKMDAYEDKVAAAQVKKSASSKVAQAAVRKTVTVRKSSRVRKYTTMGLKKPRKVFTNY